MNPEKKMYYQYCTKISPQAASSLRFHLETPDGTQNLGFLSKGRKQSLNI
jgi:hypothetical protein